MERNVRKQEHCIEDSEKLNIDIDRIVSGEDPRTTLMVRNIPNSYTQIMLISHIEECMNGKFRGQFDFFYLPMDLRNHCNVGYHFINFISTADIAAFVAVFSGKTWDRFNSGKVCIVNYARIQGLKSLYEHFAKTSLMDEAPCNQPITWIPQTDNQLRRVHLGAVVKEESM